MIRVWYGTIQTANQSTETSRFAVFLLQDCRLERLSIYRNHFERRGTTNSRSCLRAIAYRSGRPNPPRVFRTILHLGNLPHVQRLVSKGKSIGEDHAKNNRSLLRNHIFPDPISQIRLSEIRRADVLDFRTRLVAKLGYTRTVQRTMSALKVMLKEAFFREEIERDLAAGVGNTKYEAAETGVFTADELRMLFPPQIPWPWANVFAYAVLFLLLRALECVVGRSSRLCGIN
jgi:hypothetical protein